MLYQAVSVVSGRFSFEKFTARPTDGVRDGAAGDDARKAAARATMAVRRLLQPHLRGGDVAVIHGRMSAATMSPRSSQLHQPSYGWCAGSIPSVRNERVSAKATFVAQPRKNTAEGTDTMEGLRLS